MSSLPPITWSNLSATPANFVLSVSGLYQFQVVASAWNSGSVTLNILGPDGSTFLSMAVQSANGGELLYIQEGTYQLTIASATGVSASLTRCNI
jgi:hypothetical protein